MIPGKKIVLLIGVILGVFFILPLGCFIFFHLSQVHELNQLKDAISRLVNHHDYCDAFNLLQKGKVIKAANALDLEIFEKETIKKCKDQIEGMIESKQFNQAFAAAGELMKAFPDDANMLAYYEQTLEKAFYSSLGEEQQEVYQSASKLFQSIANKDVDGIFEMWLPSERFKGLKIVIRTALLGRVKRLKKIVNVARYSSNEATVKIISSSQLSDSAKGAIDIAAGLAAIYCSDGLISPTVATGSGALVDQSVMKGDSSYSIKFIKIDNTWYFSLGEQENWDDYLNTFFNHL